MAQIDGINTNDHEDFTRLQGHAKVSRPTHSGRKSLGIDLLVHILVGLCEEKYGAEGRVSEMNEWSG